MSKNTFILFLFLLFPDYGFTQAKYLNAFHAETMADYDAEICLTPDSGCAVFLSFYDATISKDRFALFRFNKNDSLIWAKKFDIEEKFDQVNIASTKDSGFILLGGLGAADVIKTDQLGNVLWSRDFFKGTLLSTGIDAIEVDGDSLLILFNGPSNSQYDTYCGIAKTDSAGHVIWMNQYKNPLGPLGGIRMLQISQNHFVILGHSYNSNLADLGISLFCIDQNGEILWSREYGDFGFFEPADMAYSNGNLTVTGDSYFSQDQKFRFWQAQFDTSGNNLKIDYYYSPTINCGTQLSVCKLPDESNVFLDCNVLFKTDKKGNLISIHEFPESDYGLFDVEVGMENNLWIAGYAEVNNDGQFSLLKTNMDMDLLCLDTVNFEFGTESAILPTFNQVIYKEAYAQVDSFNYVAVPYPDEVIYSCEDTCVTNAGISLSTSRICSGSVLEAINASTNATNFKWYVDDLLITTTPNLSYLTSNPGAHNISLIAKGECKDTAEINFFVDSLPDATFSVTRKMFQCEFTANAINNESWKWDFGDGKNAYWPQSVHFFDSVGSYSVCLTTSNTCGAATECQSISIDDTVQSRFVMFCGISGNNLLPVQVVRMGDGGYLLLSNNAGLTPWIIRTDFKGNELWTIGSPGGMALSVTPTRDGGFAIVSGESGLAVTRYDSIGKLLWKRKFSGSVNNYADIIETSDESLLIAGQDNSKAVVLKLTKAGLTLWKRSYTETTFASKLYEAKNGDLLITGGYSNDLLVFRSDAAGVPIWGKKYYGPSADAGYGIVESANGNILVTGNTSSFGGSYVPKPIILRLEEDGDMLWAKLADIGVGNAGFGINELQSGNLQVLSGGEYDAQFIKLNSAGGFLHAKKYSFPFKSRIQKPAFTADNGFATLYTETGSVDWFPYLLKADSNGYAGCYSDSVVCNIVNLTPSITNLNITSTYDTIPLIYIPMYSTYYSTAEEILCDNFNCSIPNTNFTYTSNGNTVSFEDNTTSEDLLHWDFGDGFTSTEQNPAHTYISPGEKTVCLIANNECGDSIVCKSVFVNCIAAANFSSSANDLEVEFTNTSASATGYLWDFGDGTNSSITSPVHSYSSLGTFHVCLIAYGLCVNDTTCMDVTLQCSTESDFTYTTNVNQVFFTNQAINTLFYFWEFGDGQQSFAPNPNHTYTANGIYTACLTAYGDCDTPITCKEITIIATGITDPVNLFSIYPNPASEYIHVDYCCEEHVTVEIINSLNQVRLKESLSRGEKLINVKEYPPGIYQCKIYDSIGRIIVAQKLAIVN
ncbi:MAG: PKD domain-containing protein [Chitinophagales bacterium]